MQLARIVGTAVTAVGHRSLQGRKLLICQPINEQGQEDGLPLVAIDELGAGLHSRVVLTSDGKTTRQSIGDEQSPLRYMVLALADEEGPCA